MSPLEPHGDLLDFISAVIPKGEEGYPVFQAPWQARVFALMVVAVKNGHLSWPDFQGRLVAALAMRQSGLNQPTLDEIDEHYFDGWLEAAESTLLEGEFVTLGEVARQIDVIRASIAEIRDGQLSHDN